MVQSLQLLLAESTVVDSELSLFLINIQDSLRLIYIANTLVLGVLFFIVMRLK